MNKKVSMRLLDQESKALLRQAFDDLEIDLKIDGMSIILTTAVLELSENAVKANLKRAFFLKHGFDIEDAISYEKGMKEFRASYRIITSKQYVQTLHDLDLLVSVETSRDNNSLLIHVENNSVPLAQEEKRIRLQLAAAMGSEKFSDFFLNFGDETEGGGLGLAMIVFLIRSLNFEPNHFRIFHKDGRTIARLEFPLTENYVPIRDRWMQGSGNTQQ